jgi:hypothetical protein
VATTASRCNGASRFRPPVPNFFAELGDRALTLIKQRLSAETTSPDMAEILSCFRTVQPNTQKNQPLEVLEPIVKYEFIRIPDRSTDLEDDLVVGRVPGRAANPKRPRKPRN